LNRSWMYLVHDSSNCKRIYTTPLQPWVGLPHSQLRWWPDWVFGKPWWLQPVCFQGQVHSDKQMYSDSITMVNWMEIFNYLCDLKNPVTYLHHVASWQSVRTMHQTSHGLWFAVSGVKFSKCSMKMILKYWKQKEHHGAMVPYFCWTST
jgi:hypothetical protein